MSEEKSVSLYFTEGSSDKVYNAQLVQSGDGWDVNFQYGPRGKALKSGSKGQGLPYEKALSVYDKLVLSKTKKGYTEDLSGAVFTSAEFAGRVTEFKPQLLNEVSVEEALKFGSDWLMQIKHDGERRGAMFKDGKVVFANRKGLEVGVQQPVAEAFEKLAKIIGEPLAVDCEDMGDHLVIFDVTEHFMLTSGTFEDRAAVLAHIQKTLGSNGIHEGIYVDVPRPLTDLASEMDSLRKAHAEGIVLRHKDSLYTPGRPNSGGEALKIKFWEDCSVRVTEGRVGKNSVGMEALDADGNWTFVGNVTVPEGQKPAIGEIIDVKYLYYHTGGSLFQPTFRGVRTDVAPEECRIDRMKHRMDIEIPFGQPDADSTMEPS